MPSYMSSIGFPVPTEDDFYALAQQAATRGETINAPNGKYIRWQTGCGAELWAEADRSNNLIGLVPHFTGKATMHVRLEARITYPEAPILDGAFYGWAGPGEARAAPDPGIYPFVFDAPDYALHHKLALPAVCDVQLAGLAHEVEVYVSDEEYSASHPEFATEAFIPTGLSKPSGESIDLPQSYAIIAGHLLDTSLITNPVTRVSFYWAKVRTFGGEIDLVADPEIIIGTLVTNGVVFCACRLSGRIRTGRTETRRFWN